MKKRDTKKRFVGAWLTKSEHRRCLAAGNVSDGIRQAISLGVIIEPDSLASMVAELAQVRMHFSDLCDVMRAEPNVIRSDELRDLINTVNVTTEHVSCLLSAARNAIR